MNCTNCGNQVGDHAAFCGSCGSPVHRASPPASPASDSLAPPLLLTAPPISVRANSATSPSAGTSPSFISLPPGFEPTTDRSDVEPIVVVPAGVPDDIEATKFNPRGGGAWMLVLPDGRRVAVAHAVLVGRDPAQLKDWPTAELLAVDDPDDSVSKTHAAFVVDNGAFFMQDLNSTNGAIVTAPSGEERESGGKRVPVDRGSVVEIGSYAIRIE